MVQAVTVVLPAAEPVVKIPVGHGVQPAAPAVPLCVVVGGGGGRIVMRRERSVEKFNDVARTHQAGCGRQRRRAFF